jgi:hypothetical protein
VGPVANAQRDQGGGEAEGYLGRRADQAAVAGPGEAVQRGQQQQDNGDAVKPDAHQVDLYIGG